MTPSNSVNAVAYVNADSFGDSRTYGIAGYDGNTGAFGTNDQVANPTHDDVFGRDKRAGGRDSFGTPAPHVNRDVFGGPDAVVGGRDSFGSSAYGPVISLPTLHFRRHHSRDSRDSRNSDKSSRVSQRVKSRLSKVLGRSL